jgi:cell division protein FtsI/penicillin-binding protein 2
LYRKFVISRAAPLLFAALLLAQVPAVGRQLERPKIPDASRITWSAGRATAALASGKHATLTLNPDLQKRAERLLAAARPVAGAIVALDPKTGRILAWAERPPSDSESLLLQAKAPAASLFKIVTTAALLERTAVTLSTRICTTGGQHGIERRHLEPARNARATCMPFFQALGHSRNAAYAQLATGFLMRTDLVDMADRFGFNQTLPFDVDVPLGSVTVPYNDLEFARTAAGFRSSTLSPLGAAYLAYIVATSGYAKRLYLIESAGTYRAPEKSETLRRVIRTVTARRLRSMMEVTAHGGTSLEAFTDESGRSYLGTLRVAGKTGTLQLNERAPTTSWFIGFAPSRQPEIVVSVLLQNGRVWHKKANEVARDLLRSYFAERGVRGVSDPYADHKMDGSPNNAR